MNTKEYWLALWWWAARWFIHIWVIKYLEENNIDIKEVSGTSMWAIIAALYAMGKTSEEMTEIAKDINFLKLIDFDFKSGLIKWNKIKKVLEELYWDTKIEDLDMKLKIVATDIEAWEKFVFEKGRIVDAVRSSLSLPWIISPSKVWETLYVDGWLTNNLPVDVLETDNCIWVSALKKVTDKLVFKRKILWLEFNKWLLEMNYNILHRTILIMMKQNEEKSIEKKQNLTLLSPSFWDLDYYSFRDIDNFIEIGYKEAAEKILKK